jgi:hypothetical protein
MQIKLNEYQCVICKGIFEKCWSDEEAMKEYNENFPNESKEKIKVVCDDCWQIVKPEKTK